MNKECKHKLTHELETWTVEYCPKGCDGTSYFKVKVYCEKCGKIIYEADDMGKLGCKYGH